MTRGARRRGRLTGSVAGRTLATSLAVALAACSGTPTAAPSQAPIVAGPTPTVTTYVVGTWGWIDGFVVTVISATASLDPKGGTLTVEATLENAGEDEATLDAPIVVTAGDATFQLSHGTVLPDLAGGATAAISLPFDVVGRGNVDEAVLRIGRDGEHRVAIPMRQATGGATTLEPHEADLKGTGRAGNLTASIRHVQLRWDLPDWHDELPATSEVLTLTYDVTYTGSFSGGFPFTAENVRLRLPDGKTYVDPRPDGHSQSIQLLKPGRIARGLTSRFEIPDGLTGTFALLIDDGGTKHLIPFVVGP